MGFDKLLELGFSRFEIVKIATKLVTNPDEAFLFLQKFVDRLFESATSETEQMGNQVLSEILPKYDCTFQVDSIDGAKELYICIRPKEEPPQ